MNSKDEPGDETPTSIDVTCELPVSQSENLFALPALPLKFFPR